MSPLSPEEIRLWYSPDWCDFRWRISGCTDSTLWHIFYIIHTIWAYLATILGIWVVYKKIYRGVWAKGLSIWTGWRPRAAESFLLGSVVHMFGRALYSSVLLGVKDPEGFGSHALAEVLHDLPWIILFDAMVFFVIGIIHATPRHRLKESTTDQVRLPSPRTLTIILLVCTNLPPITLPLFAGLDGRGRDMHDMSFSKTFHYLHHGFWAAYCWGWAAVLAYFGVVLLKLLRENIRDLGGDDNESAAVKQAKDLAEYKRAIKSTAIIIGILIVSLVASAGVLMFYAIFRYQIHTIRALNILFGMTWIFIFPTILTPIFIVMLWGIYKSNESQSRRNNQASGSGSGGSRASATVPSISATQPVSPTLPIVARASGSWGFIGTSCR